MRYTVNSDSTKYITINKFTIDYNVKTLQVESKKYSGCDVTYQLPHEKINQHSIAYSKVVYCALLRTEQHGIKLLGQLT